MPIFTLGQVSDERKETCKENKKQYPIVGLEHLNPEELLVINRTGSDNNSFSKMFRAGDVLFGRRRAYLKKAAKATFDGICSGDITVISAIPEVIYPDLLPFIIQYDELFDYAVGKSAGSLSPRVKWEHLSKYRFKLPEMDEQRKIAQVLWGIYDTRFAYQELLDATDAFVQAEYKDLIQNGSNQKTYKIKKILHQYKKTEKIIDTKKERFISVPLYGKGIVERDIGNDDIKPFTAVRIHEGQFIYSRIWVRKGACGLVPSELNNAIVTNEFPVFDIDKNIVVPEFLLYAILDESFLQQIGAYSTGSTSKQRLKESTFKEFNITLPPIDEQRQFAEMVNQSKIAKANLSVAIENVKALQRRIVRDNFIIPREVG